MAFLPTNISGCGPWYKADALSLLDGSGVATWIDSSASGFNITQTTSTKQPAFKTNVINGLPVVRFDSSKSTGLSGVSKALNSSAFTSFVVFKTPINTSQCLFANDAFTGTQSQ